MKILYGVQGTGNGHISRAKAMGAALEEYPDVEVTWLFSGRAKEALFGVADNFMWRRGLTFASADGEVSYLKTAVSNNFVQFVRDVRTLDLTPYDQVVCDYEPVLAWAAKLRGIKTLGLGHQYAFEFPVPRQGDNLLNRAVMKHFAPATYGLGLHWHHFEKPILPPIVDLEGVSRERVIPNKVVVYLPFEDQVKVIRMLRKVEGHEFYLYGPGLTNQDTCNVHTRELSRIGFKKDLVSAESVVCNSGFELISECLSLGIRVLAKPLAQQVEQLSNARALEVLNYGTISYQLSAEEIALWLESGKFVQINYPSVHAKLARWLVTGQRESREELANNLWDSVDVHYSDKLTPIAA